MARNAAAMPQLVCRNCLRLKPRCLPFTSASSLIRASTFFWIALCGGGRYSPLETIWVGIGVAADAASAPATRRCSRSLSHVLIVLLPFCWRSHCWVVRAPGCALGHSQQVWLTEVRPPCSATYEASARRTPRRNSSLLASAKAQAQSKLAVVVYHR